MQELFGKGNYSFCKNIEGLNQVIISNLNDICTFSINNLNLNSNLDKISLYNTNHVQLVAKPNKIYRFKYITKERPSEKKISFIVRYKKDQQDFKENYELEPIELPSGEELAKLIIYHDILKNKSEEEKIKLALKYQIFIEGTSLFTEVELSGKITQPIKQKEIKYEKKENKNLSLKQLFGNKNKKKQKNNGKRIEQIDDIISEKESLLVDLENRSNDLENEAKEKIKMGDKAAAKRILKEKKKIFERMKQTEGYIAHMEEQKMMLDYAMPMKNLFYAIKSANCACKMEVNDLENMKENIEEINPDQYEINEFFKDNADEDDDDVDERLEELEEQMAREECSNSLPCANKEISEKNKNKKYEENDLNDFLCSNNENVAEKELSKEEATAGKKESEKDIKLNLKNKDDVMKIVNCQDFISGFWDINNKTKNVKNKYEKEFKLLKGLNKIDDIVAMTVIIIYFINKEHRELLDELILIIKKAKLYIQDKIGDSYENIIKKAGIK